VSWFNKEGLCEAAGIEPLPTRLPANASFAAVHDSIQTLNRRDDVDGIVLERPVPAGLDADVLGSYIAADKDVDDESRSSRFAEGGALMAYQAIFQASPDLQLDLAPLGSDEPLGRPPRPPWLCSPPGVLPCTVVGILHLLHRSSLMDHLLPAGLTVVVGRSPQLGAPLARELVKANATVAVCHSATPPDQLRKLCQQADCLIVAAGSPGLITKDMVKPGAVVINCGTTFSPALSQLLPDVDDDVAQVAAFVTPTPHGVGPTCAAALLLNTLTLAEAAARRRDLEKRHKAAAALELPPATAAAAAAAAAPPGSMQPIPAWQSSECRETGTPLLRRTYTCGSYRAAVEVIADITVLAERANHHPTFAVNPARRCEMQGGCDLVVELSSYSTKTVTAADLNLARRLDCLVASTPPAA